MDAMTMPYKLKDANILSELHPGDLITADLLVSQNADADLALDHIVVVGQAKPDYKPKIAYHVPAPGDAVPDFKLRNQDGRTIHLDQFRGKQLLITFIYTRCPLPNFCPRVTRNFADIDRQLAASTTLHDRTHLLCVSFDPEQRHARAAERLWRHVHRQRCKRRIQRIGTLRCLKSRCSTKMAEYFDVGITRSTRTIRSPTRSRRPWSEPTARSCGFIRGMNGLWSGSLTDMRKTAGA